MKTIKKDFEELKNKVPEWGDYIILLTVVKGKGYSKQVLGKAFNSLVSKEQYDKSEKNDYLEYLWKKNSEVI